MHIWRVLIDLFRSCVLADADEERETAALLEFVRMTDELDKGLLTMVAGYQNAQSRMSRMEHERRGESIRLLMDATAAPSQLRQTLEAHGLDPDGTFHTFRARPADDRKLQRLDACCGS